MENNKIENSMFLTRNLNKWVQPQSYYMHFYKNFDMVVHSHERIEIVYVVLGELKVEIQNEDESFETILVHPNNYVFIDGDVPHKMSVSGVATKIYNMEFCLADSKDPAFTLFGLSNKDDAMRKFLFGSRRVIKIADDGLFLQNMLIVQKYLGDTPSIPCDNYLSYQFSALFLILAKQSNFQKNASYGVIHINRALTYIYDNYNCDITLKSIADYCEISQNYLNNIFSKNLNLTVNNFVNKYRIQRAMLLLESSEMSIEEIYKQIGYHNKMSFHKNFIKFSGITPQKYRKITRSSNVIKNSPNQSPNMYFL